MPQSFNLLTTNERIYMLEVIPNQSTLEYWVNGTKAWLNYLQEKRGGQVTTAITQSMQSVSINNDFSKLESVSLTKRDPGSTSNKTKSDGVFDPNLDEPLELPFLPTLSSSLTPDELRVSLDKKNRELAAKNQRIEDLERRVLELEGRLGILEVRDVSNVAAKKREERYWRLIKEDNVNEFRGFVTPGALDTRKKFLAISSLFFAIESGSLQIVQYLIEQGSNVNSCDSLGRTPLLIAIERLKDVQCINIVQFLISKGANVEKGDTSDNDFPPLHASCRTGNKDVAKLLIKAGADINKRDGNLGWTPLHWAAASGVTDVVNLLLERKADVVKVKGVSPISIAQKEKGNPEIVKLIKQYAKTRKNNKQ